MNTMTDTSVIDAAVAAADGPAQRSAEWLYQRVGYCTASKFRDVQNMTSSGGKSKVLRRNYMIQLAVERLTNEPTNHYTNAAMEWGTAQEAQARMAYEARTGAIVDEVGFLHHPALEWCGGSPDGLVGTDGLVEFKCPYESAVHVTTLLEGAMPAEHMPQVQGLLWITGRQWCDFVSYDPRMPKGLDMFVQRIERDDAYIATLETEVIKFLAEVAAALAQMQEKLKEYAE